MIIISQAEKDSITTRFPNVCIVRTMKQKSKRHRYYCEESRQVMRYLYDVLRAPKISKETKGEGYHTTDKGNK